LHSKYFIRQNLRDSPPRTLARYQFEPRFAPLTATTAPTFFFTAAIRPKLMPEQAVFSGC
jgi:hypothetical protein